MENGRAGRGDGDIQLSDVTHSSSSALVISPHPKASLGQHRNFPVLHFRGWRRNQFIPHGEHVCGFLNPSLELALNILGEVLFASEDRQTTLDKIQAIGYDL